MNVDINKIPAPCYVLDESLLIRNLGLLKRVQDEAGVSIICALKGFSFHAEFPLLKKYLQGATASSLHEARLVQEEMGVKAHTYCPVYIPGDFEEIREISSHLTFNSISQWERYKDQVGGVSCGLRVNPGYSEISTALYDPASPTSRLGIPREQLTDQLPAGISGLHFHALCENNSHTLERVLDSFTALYEPLIRQAKWVNMGGGHLITRGDYDVEHGIRVLKVFRETYPNLEEVILEPGSAVGWETGYLVATILDIVENGGQKTAMLDVSFTCHMPDCLEMPYQPKVLGSVETSEHAYHLGGSSCLAGDAMGVWFFEKPLHIGQKIVFNDMIHYTMVKTSTFNGINLPNIGIWRNGQFEPLRSFGYDDYKNRLS
jgi:carboxynorspermidine decarboxylase